ncbi:hypothetical protein BH09BAC1_BH09BAC1_01180 [soil metagenome]
MFRHCLFFILLIGSGFLGNKAQASHAVGADLSYECLGGNQYRITYTFYRDCAGINPSTSYTMNIRSNSCNRTISVNLPRISVTELQTRCATQQNTTRCNGGSNPGFQEHVYSGIVTFPAQCTDWVISYGECCRNSAITNLSNPGSNNLYVEARLNNTISPCDNSPTFTTKPVPFICVGQQTFYNHGAIDIDGDSLSYTIINPLSAAGSNIPFTGGTNVNTPVRVTGPFQFNTQTGQMIFTPSQTQNAVVTVLVREYRNGVLIGSTMRDIQVVVINCPNNSPPEMSGIDGTGATFNGQPANFQTSICGGNPLCFDILFKDPNAGNVLTVTYNNLPAGATLTLSGTQPPVGRFCWSPAAGQSGTFNFIVTVDDGACPIPARAIQSFTINVSPSSYTVSSNVVAPTCPGGSNGSASISISSGAIPPVTYRWPGGQTGPSVSNMQAGPYAVTITDGSNCSTVANVVIPGPPAMVLNATTTPSVCNGAASGTATVTVTGGTSANGTYRYLWSVNNPTNTTNSISGLSSGNYNVTVTDDNNCTATTNAFVFQPGPLVISLSAASISNYNGAEISCNGAADGIIQATASGGTLPYVYQWSPNANGQTTNVINNLGPGSYFVTLTDNNNCNTGTSVSITEPDPVVATAVVYSNYNGADISCFGANDGAARVTATGGTGTLTYQWDAAANNQTSRTATNLGPGTYSVTVTDINNCSAVSSATLTEPTVLQANVFSTATVNGYNISCFGGSDGGTGANVTGGTPGYNYSWSDPLNQNTPYASGLTAGPYTLRVTDINGCSVTQSITLLQPPALSLTATVTSNYNGYNVSCSGEDDGAAIANPVGGIAPYTYVWNDPSSQLTQTAIGLNANIPYTVLVSDANECTQSATVTLTEPTPITSLTAVNSNYNGRQISCFQGADGAASVLAGGGSPPYSFQWSPVVGGSSGAAITGLSAGRYIVTVTDANSCAKIDSIKLVDPPELLSVAASIKDATCFGKKDAAAFVIPSGGTAGYRYQWDFYAGTQITDTARNLRAGTYNVTVTDTNNCESVSSVTVYEPTELVATTITTDILCNGFDNGMAEVAASGGIPNYVYTWSTNPVQTAAMAIGLAPGIYDVVVTDNNGCTTTKSAEIFEPAPLTVSSGKTDPSCFGYADGMAYVTVGGGVPNYVYKWNNQSGTNQVLNIVAGVYVMEALDANGCLITDTIELVDPPTTGINIMPDSSLIPLGGNVKLSTTVTTSANTQLSYVWEPAYGLSCTNCPNPVANPLYAVTYTVEMTDGDGCKTSAKALVDVNTKNKLYFIPNAFSPNGDGYNDVFFIYGKAVSNVKLLIYDRWGEKMFEGHSLSEGWDGRLYGTLMAPGVFVYYAEIYFENGDRVEEKGSVTLMR